MRFARPFRMRLLVAAFAALLGASAVMPAPAAAAPEVITLSPQSAKAYWFGVAWSVPLNLSGKKAKPRSTVSVTAPCAIGTCSASTTVGRKGAWSIGFDPVVKAHSGSLTISVRLDGRELRRTFNLVAPAGSAPRSKGVIVVGDSLAQGSAGYLPGLLPGRNVTTQARAGRTLATGLRVFGHTPIDRRVQVAVFSLFTNDDPRAVSELRSAVHSTMKRLGSRRCAVWYTIRRPKLAGTSYKQVNDALHTLAADPRYVGRLFVVPWYETISDNHKLLIADRVHGTPAGYAKRAQLTAEAVKRCAVAPR